MLSDNRHVVSTGQIPISFATVVALFVGDVMTVGSPTGHLRLSPVAASQLFTTSWLRSLSPSVAASQLLNRESGNLAAKQRQVIAVGDSAGGTHGQNLQQILSHEVAKLMGNCGHERRRREMSVKPLLCTGIE